MFSNFEVLIIVFLVLNLIFSVFIFYYLLRHLDCTSYNSKNDLSLTVDDINLIRPVLNEYMKTLDKNNGFGSSLSSDYWPLMLKFTRILYVLEHNN